VDGGNARRAEFYSDVGTGYVFITWKGDHPPRHVHVYRDGTLVVKWDLDNQKAMKGAATRRILELIRELETEGLL
jgi:hypothetical protein